MATKTISTTYADGYTLAVGYSGLSITNEGAINSAPGDYPSGRAGVALVMPNGGALTSDGHVDGGVGGLASATPGPMNIGGGGGVGVSLSAVGQVENLGVMAGGNGGAGGQGLDVEVNYPGGGGGTGLALSEGGSITNSGSILGGAGGIGGSYHGPGGPAAPASVGAVGGGGGDAIDIWDGSLVNSGLVAGGAGGNAGLGYGGQGGVGGVGVSIATGGSISNQGGQIVGGAAGDGAYEAYSGVGGAGISLTGGGLVTNSSGEIAGGRGGNGGLGSYSGNGMAGGIGGAGISAEEPAWINNAGLIEGGHGGDGGPTIVERPGYQSSGAGGDGGVGVDLAGGGFILNSGTIRGGAGGVAGPIEPGVSRGYGGLQGYGLAFGASGSVRNYPAGLIEGAVGVELVSTATLMNFGTVEGSAGVSVDLRSSSDRLVAESGSTFIGEAVGGGGVLELPDLNGTITGLGASGTVTGSVNLIVSGFGAYQLYGGAMTFDGTNVINSGVSLTVTGTFNNAGVIKVSGVGAATSVIIKGSATLFGAGSIVLESGGVDRIYGSTYYGATARAVLTNFSTISGTGSVGLGELMVDNEAAGVIDATGAMALDTAGATLTNAGLLEATDGGTLGINDTRIANTGGTMAAAGGVVDLQNSDVVGGVLAGTRPINVNTGSSTVDGADAGAIALDGTVQVLAGTTLTAEGTLSGTGSVNLYGGGKLIVGASGLTLTGGGHLDTNPVAADTVVGASATATLTNVSDHFNGVGRLGDGSMILINEAAGTILDAQTQTLTIDTGAQTIINAGIIESDGAGGVIIDSAIANTGTLIATAGTLSLDGLVTGAGVGKVAGGVLVIAAGPFAETVTFSGTTGVLELDDSQGFTGAIRGLSKTGTNWLSLVDITFQSGATKASYSGTSAEGVLTVTDGTHTAKITLFGNYTTTKWTLSAASGGGTKVVDTAVGHAKAGAAAIPPTHAFVQTAAALGAASDAAPGPCVDTWRSPAPALVLPGPHTP